jgi:UDP-N-acetylglucosamine--N-acetylmuramyl-(pentapeptide) pyrophosphoryl-undecaprenol N-acetylglucosamine transferase
MSARILLAAGGTGGHVYPAIAIADALKALRPDLSILFAGTRTHMEWTAVPKAGYAITSIWISGLIRRLTLLNLLFPVKLLVSLVQSLTILLRYRPDLVVSCGGYVAGPIGWMAAKRGVPVVVQEQNSFPGVTNRMLGKHADRVYVAYAEAAAYFPGREVRLTGNPVRAALAVADRAAALRQFGFDPERKTLLVMGGSGGAHRINDAMLASVGDLHEQLGLNILWQCGARYHARLAEAMDMDSYPRLTLLPFIDSMPEAYAVADLVLCRSGAGTIAELTVTGKPMILVPSPHVAGDHQTHNANAMADAGAAVRLADGELTTHLLPTVSRLLAEPTTLSAMATASSAMAKPDAAAVIAADILSLIDA